MRNLLIYLCFAMSVAAGTTWTGRVVGVIDGDTIKVLRQVEGKSVEVRIRLEGIDAPESHQAFGAKAKQALSDLVMGKSVTVVAKGTDRYGRTLAKITLSDGRDAGEEMVRGGWAWWFERYAPKDSKLKALQEEARAAKHGLWADAQPEPPWKYRQPRLGSPMEAPQR